MYLLDTICRRDNEVAGEVGPVNERRRIELILHADGD